MRTAAAAKSTRVGAWLVRVGLASVGGLLLFAAFTEAGSRVGLSLIALVPLLTALAGLAPGDGFRVGWVAGLAFNVGGYYWLVGTIRDFGGFPLPICLLFFAILCAYQALSLGLVGWLYRRLSARGVTPVVAFAAPLVGVELAFPPLFPSFVGGSLHAVPHLLQVVDLGGPMLLSAIVAAVNVAIYELGRALIGRRRPPLGVVGLPLALAVATIGYGHFRIRDVEARMAVAPRMRIGLVQANIDINARERDPFGSHLRHIEQTIELQRAQAPDLILWPESGFYHVLPDGLRNLRGLVTVPEMTTPLIFGGARRDAAGRTFNTAFLLDPEGNVLGTYDKTYLLTFGEYLPFGEAIPELYTLSPATGRHARGEHLRPLVLGDYRLTTLICFEDLKPNFTRRAVRSADPHLLINLTNDSWFGDTLEPWLHLGLSKLRAVEHHRYLVRSTNTGVSAFIDPVGRVVLQSGTMTVESLVSEVGLIRPWTLYGLVGDLVGWVGLAVSLVLGWRPLAMTFGADPG